MKMNAWWRLAALTVVLAGPCFAEQAPAKKSEVAIVPYDPAKPVAQQKPDQFYLPYERFLELWEAAKQSRAEKKPEPAQVAFVLSAARYQGVLGERAMTFTGKLDVTTYNEHWVNVPLLFKDVKVSALKIDGVVAAYDGTQIIIEKPGRHQVEVAFEIPLPRGVQALEWGIPRTGATLLALTLPDDRTRATVTPGSGVIEQIENGKKRATSALGATDRVRVEWKTSAATTRIAEPALAAIRTQLVARIGREETDTEFAFSFPGARQDRFTVYFDKGLTLHQLDAPNVKSWRLFADGARQALEIVLNEPADETYSFQIGTERPRTNLPADLKAPVFSAAAKRVEYTALALCVGDRIELTPRPDGTQRQIIWDHPIGNSERVVAAYAGVGEVSYRVALREAQREARVDYVYQVNRRKIELIASLQLFAKGDDLSTLTLSLPAQFEVQAIESERLQDWWREGDTLHLRFRGATPERTPLVVYLVRQYAAAPTDLEVRPLVLDGFKKIEGEAVIAAHKGVEAAMKLTADGKEIAPERAATDFQILPPLERKRGFSFTNQTFAAQVTLAALPAKTSALWVMHAQAHEGWVALSTHARLTMRQGSIDRATFSLPAAVAEARVSGAEVRETRSRVEGDRRVYEVQFQNDVYESVEFTADLELPNPGEAPLPAITFPESQMTSGFVLTDNASEFEMKLKTSGVDPAPTSEVPFLPALSKSAGIFRAQPKWAVTIAVERLEKAATRAAFVAWAELTTALRRDGTEWHRATYRLQNRSLQFLPVKMPAGAELMSARVAGQNVRADAGKVKGTAAILVPLIKTRPGDLSYDVELVYRVNGPALSWWTGRKLDDPELLGITVERTFWNVWLPEDRKLQSSSGNMEPVLAEVNKADKLEGALLELKSLVSIASSTSSSYDAREVAIGNIGRLKKEIEAENRDENFEQSYRIVRKGGKDPSPTPAEETVGRKGLAQQGAYVANKRREVSDQLGQEVQKLAEANKTAPQAGQIVGLNPLTAGNRSGSTATSSNAIDALLFAPQANVPLPNQNDISQQAVAPDARWMANHAFAQQGVVAATPAPAAGAQGNNFYFNDNVVLQQRLSVPEAKDTTVSEKKKMPVPATPMEKAAAALEDGEKKPQVSALNTARGNSVRFQEEQLARQQGQVAPQPGVQAPSPMREKAGLAPQGQPSAAPTLPMAVAAATPAPAQAARQGDTGRVTIAGVVAGGGVAGANVNAPAASDAQRLQSAGRISLAVDFPTEGQLFHFKKVKANAQLGLTVITPESFVRWKYLGAALTLAGVLVWIGRLAERRRKAAASPMVAGEQAV